MKNKRFSITIIGLIVFITALFLFFKLTVKNDMKNLQGPNEQESQISVHVELTEEEKIYNELIGNLTNVINISEKEQLQKLINEIVQIENDSNDDSKKAAIYKQIIKVLDEVTFRGHSQEDLDNYKEYYDATQDASLSMLVPQYQYEIKGDGEIVPLGQLDESTNGNVIHKELWEEIKKIIPFELLKDIKYFVSYEVNKSVNNGYAPGFIQPADFSATPYEWIIGVADNAEKGDLPYILIHEYGHYISLKDTSLNFNDGFKNIKAEGNGILQNFVKECLGHIAEELDNISQDNHYLFYARHKDNFVTKYSASNLLEDFAESFAKFVTDANYESEILKRKMKFFNDRSELVEIKKQILTNMKKNNIGEISSPTQ